MRVLCLARILAGRPGKSPVGESCRRGWLQLAIAHAKQKLAKDRDRCYCPKGTRTSDVLDS